MNRIEEIKRKIRSLKKMTVENGCTQEEALRAAEKARSLLSEYNIDDDALNFEEVRVDFGRSTQDIADKMCSVIAIYCGCYLWKCRTYNSAGKKTLEVVYFGKEPSPTLAEYVHDVCFRALATAVEDEKETLAYKSRRNRRTRGQHIKAFKDGFAMALSAKLIEKAPLDAWKAYDIAKAQAAGGGLTFKKTRELTKVDNRISGVTYSGYKAGQDFALNDAVATPAHKQIGGPS
ncbi:MAG: DUF2786 domain-containing protein [Emcibacter sp.]|nr:DUF2786 domain-containing protein [Emcibacter sp.]